MSDSTKGIWTQRYKERMRAAVGRKRFLAFPKLEPGVSLFISVGSN